jgi:5S rRNA maturation endonuclease (ribonuclease M5)
VTRDEIKAALPLKDEFERRGVEFTLKSGRLMACCPFHEDSTPSLTVDEKEDVFHCYGCSASGSVIDAWALFEGVPVKDAFQLIERHLGVHREEKKAPPQPSPDRKLVKTYDYTDEDGKMLFQVCRFEPKDFRQRVPRGSGWEWGLNGVRRVLYHLEDIIACNTAVFFCEGEKDADLLHGMGLCATTVPMGAGKWDDSYTPFFKGKTIIVLPDNDEPGQKHAKLLCEKLGPVARAVKIISPDASVKDVSDWAGTFPSPTEFGKHLLGLLRSTPTVAGADTLPIYDMGEMEGRYQTFISRADEVCLNFGCLSERLGKAIRPLVPGDVCVIMADTGVGKTFVLQNIAYRCGLPVLFFELELSDPTLFERFAAMASGSDIKDVEATYKRGLFVEWGRSPHMNKVLTCIQSGLTVDQVRNYIIQSELKSGTLPAVVIVDYIGLMKSNGSRYERMSDVAEGLKGVAKDTNTIIVISSQIARKADDSTAEIFLHDAKDSGSIENSAQLALGMWRDPENNTRIWTKILKNSKGTPGLKVPMQFDTRTLRLYEEVSYCEDSESSSQPNGFEKKSTSSYRPRRMGSR